MEKDHEASPMERTQLRTAVSEEALLSMESFNQTAGSKPRLLLHSCCGPCSTAVIERLILRYHITVFFYNPNITDWQEYEKRKEAQLLFIRKYNEQINKADYIQFMEGIYYPTAFQEISAG
ncbi:MAG: epoxyqueuosine reductase QueH, partial [Anaerovorax sp.]